MAQGGVGLPLGQVDLINSGSGPQGLDDRVAPFNDTVCLASARRRAFAGFLPHMVQLASQLSYCNDQWRPQADSSPAVGTHSS